MMKVSWAFNSSLWFAAALMWWLSAGLLAVGLIWFVGACGTALFSDRLEEWDRRLHATLDN